MIEKFSDRGRRLTLDSGIHALMVDLAQSASGEVCMMGGGAPAHIPEADEVYTRIFREIAAEPGAVARLLGDYGAPEGDAGFRRIAAEYLRERLGWDVTTDHLAVTSGGQATFLQIFLLFGGRRGGKAGRILFPIAPEYIGYADLGMEPETFVACRPIIRETGPNRFKYEIDFNAVRALLDQGEISAVALSRPTNPSANVISDAELGRLSDLAAESEVPLIIDNAYGIPFPGVIFTEATLDFRPHWILSISFSKLGLPGPRCGLLVAAPEIINAFATLSAITHLSPGNLGPAIAGPLLASREVDRLTRDVIRPFYRKRCDRALTLLDELLPGDLDWSVHEPEGAFFLWLRIRDGRFRSRPLYEQLKRAGLLVVPGDYFFCGADPDWEHRAQCLRLSYCLSEDRLEEGIQILARELRA